MKAIKKTILLGAVASLFITSMNIGTVVASGQTVKEKVTDAVYSTSLNSENGDFRIEDGVLVEYTGEGGIITIPEEVTTIGEGAFYQCSSLKSVTIPEGVTTIGEEAFYQCSSLESVTIPEGVTKIGGRAFYQCSSLENVTIPEGVTTIAGALFYQCSSLESVIIPEGMTAIEGSAFGKCTNLEVIEIPDTVENIDGNVFEDTKWIEVKRQENPLVIINNILVDGHAYTDDILSLEGVKKVSGSSLSDNQSITSVVDTAELEKIGIYAFKGCSNLKSITNFEKLTQIDEFAFFKCSSLSSVKFSEGLTTISRSAFSECSSLSNVELPSGLTTIEGGAFYECSSLSSIELPAGLIAIGDCAFEDCSSLTEITLPKSLNTIGEYIFMGSGLKNVTIEDGVSYIGFKMFGLCKNLTEVHIPKSVSYISNVAFEDCTNLRKVVIEEGVKAIGIYAFHKCPNLTSVIIPESVTNMEGIYQEVFYSYRQKTPRHPFVECDKVVLTCKKGSFAESYASENQIPYIYEGEDETKVPTVQEKPIVVELKEATIIAKNITKTYGDKAFHIEVQVNSKGKLTYMSTNKNVAIISSTGKVTLKGYGKTTITIKAEATDKFKATEKTIILKVKPKTAKLLKAKRATAKSMIVKWKKDKKAMGYILQYSTSKNFKKNVKTVTIKKNSVTSKKITKLNKNKKYYVRVCAYKTVEGKKVTGKYCAKKCVKILR